MSQGNEKDMLRPNSIVSNISSDFLNLSKFLPVIVFFFLEKAASSPLLSSLSKFGQTFHLRRGPHRGYSCDQNIYFHIGTEKNPQNMSKPPICNLHHLKPK